MHAASIPADEPDRLVALQRYRILDTAPETCFDQLALLAAHVCETPVALISFIDEQRQWIKAGTGVTQCTIPRAVSLCAQVILQREPLIIADARADERFAGNPLVAGETQLRFYAGVPLIAASGHALGTICVMGPEPRGLSNQQCVALELLSRQVVTLAESRSARLTAPPDVAQQGMTDEAVHIAAMRLANAQTMARIGSWEIDVATNSLTYSAEMYRLLGRDPALGPMSPEEFFNSLHPDDADRVRRNYAEAVTQGTAHRVEHRYCHPTDGIRWHEGISNVIVDQQQRVISIFGTLQDITERKAVESALRASEAGLAAAQERAHIGSWELDLATQQVTASAEALRIVGLDPSAKPSLSEIVALIHPDDRRAVDAAMAQVRAGEGPAQHDVRFIRADGSIRWIERRVDLIRGPDGRPLRMIGTSQDITARKLAESALHDSEERYRRIVQTANEGIWTIDAAARTTFVNPKMADMLGYTVEEMDRRLLTDFMDDEGIAITNANIERRRQGISEQHDFKFRRKDGSELWTIMATNPITDARGAYAGAMALVTDITERRRLEDELRHAHKMEAIGRLSGGIAHDFNNQLAVILGYGSMAMTKSRDDQVTRCLTRIVGAATRSADLVKQLLSFSRKGRYSEAPVDVHGIISETLDVLGCSLSKKIRLRHAFNAGTAVVTGDASLLQNAFLNLALNARDAMPDGGDLDFTTAAVALDHERAARLGTGLAPGHYLQVTVSDTGLGMSEAVQQHLFEPFFSTKAPGQGTGLGLASVYGTITQHGGGIEVDSLVGRGTTIRVYLPTSVHAVQQPSVEPRPPEPKRAGRILVVDDEEFVAALVADTLADCGHDVVCKEDGAAGLQHYRAHWQAIDLVILDMNMPKMNGPETFAAIRAVNPHAKVLIVSGYSADGGVDTLLAQGAMGFLAKPFRPEALESEALRILEADRPASEA